MTTETRQTTAEDLLRMPDDGFRYELVGGELRKATPAGDEHGYVALNAGISLGSHVKANDLGRTYAAETGFKLASDPDTVRAPDAAFVSRERIGSTGRVQGFRTGAPDLAVEVVSPNNRHAEVVEKALVWLGAGCRMVLVVDPESRTVTVYRSPDDVRVLTAEGEGADVVPGWTLPVKELFA